MSGNIRFQVRRGLASLWTSANPILADGEIGLESDTGYFKWGDGTNVWTSLPYAGSNDIVLTTTGSSGPATYIGGTLNIPQYAGGGAWGSITGTLSSQTDLQSALNGKQATLGFTPYNATNPAGYTSNVGTVTSVSGTSPVVSSGGATPAISIPAATASVNGYLTSADWTTFNGKQAALGFTPYNATNPAGYTSNVGTVTNVSGTSPIVSSGGATPAISMPVATVSVNGYLSSADWNTFNSKQALLVSATNIKTINGSSILGSGDLVISVGGGTWGTITGTLSAQTDLQSALDGKQASLGFTPYNATNPSGYTSNVGTVTSVAQLTIGTAGTDLGSSVATGTTTPVITLNVPTASGTNRGALSSADWTTFNSKQAALGFTPYNSTNPSNYISIGAVTDSVVTSKVLTGYSTGANSTLLATDTILATFGKVQGQLNAKQPTISLTTVGSSGAATFVGNVLNIPNYAGGGAATWGTITGTLSAQTDLQSALDGKVPLAGIGATGTWGISITGKSGTVGNTHDSTGRKLWSGTQAAYTALGAWDADTAYVITDASAPAAGAGGATTQVQYNSAGALAGASDVTIQNGQLSLANDSTPTAPATDTVSLIGKKIAGSMLPAYIGPSGLDSALQPLLARNKVGYWSPAGNATTVPGVFGFTAPTVTGFTATARNVATTRMFTRFRRLGYVTAATAGAVGQWRVAASQYTIGNGAGVGGFRYICRFGVSDAATVSGARMAIGMGVGGTAPTNVEPSTLVNCLLVGSGAGDTNLKIFYGGSAAQTPIDLGANFPANTLSVDMYELALFASPNSQTVGYEVTRLNTGHVATGTLSGAVGTQVPANTTLLAPWGYRTNNATALAVGLDVASCYIETDY